MLLPYRGYADTVRDMCAAVGASAGRLVDTSIGSVLRAIIDANAGVVAWVQWLILLTLRTTRAATSSGADLDSWMSDFAFPRHPASVASGSVIFSRLSSGTVAYVPAGSLLKTADGSIIFSVVTERSHPAWREAMQSYIVGTGIATLTVAVACTKAGAAGNVVANAISLIASSLPGIDNVTNPTGTAGGGEAEVDGALRARFQDYFAARSRGTVDAIAYAVSQVQRALHFIVLENMDAQGRQRYGNVLVVVHDGTGALGEYLITAIGTAVEAVRPVGTMISIQPPAMMPVEIEISAEFHPGSDIGAIQAFLRTSIKEHINQLPIGARLSISRLSQLLYQIEPSILNIARVRIGASDEDLAAGARSAFSCTGVVFS